MGEFSYAGPHGCHVPFPSPLARVMIKGGKGASLRGITGASRTELDPSTVAPLSFSKEVTPTCLPHSPSPLLCKLSLTFGHHLSYLAENPRASQGSSAPSFPSSMDSASASRPSPCILPQSNWQPLPAQASPAPALRSSPSSPLRALAS